MDCETNNCHHTHIQLFCVLLHKTWHYKSKINICSQDLPRIFMGRRVWSQTLTHFNNNNTPCAVLSSFIFNSFPTHTFFFFFFYRIARYHVRTWYPWPSEIDGSLIERWKERSLIKARRFGFEHLLFSQEMGGIECINFL